ncbi:uncharacterized protein LOC135696761 [Rhopilema esculentum]|uniref:uncharacterized protein LOC135696761 n=1 Tax=Rhopilema esculentum TaxID=499914 RepID=UPI0031E30757|eukprot:gene13014-3783_t
MAEDTPATLRQSITPMAGEIRLNVGGTRFTTSYATLMNAPTDSPLRLLGYAVGYGIDYHIYFIDRSPENFGYVLEFLRDNRISPPSGASDDFWQAIKQEANYYKILKLESYVNHRNEPETLEIKSLSTGEVKLMFNDGGSIMTSVDVMKRADEDSLLRDVYRWIVRERSETMHGEYYIDRRSGGIQHIIDFLRYGNLPTNINENAELCNMIEEDAIFYGLKTMLKKIDDAAKKQGNGPQALQPTCLRSGEVKLMLNDGVSITTSVDVLRKADINSLLHNVYLWIVREHYNTMSGEYYIDRRSGGIQHIIDFLRDGNLPSNISENAELCNMMKGDATFYELKTMLKKIEDTVNK